MASRTFLSSPVSSRDGGYRFDYCSWSDHLFPRPCSFSVLYPFHFLFCLIIHLLTAVIAAMFVVLHIFWGLIAFKGWHMVRHSIPSARARANIKSQVPPWLTPRVSLPTCRLPTCDSPPGGTGASGLCCSRTTLLRSWYGFKRHACDCTDFRSGHFYHLFSSSLAPFHHQTLNNDDRNACEATMVPLTLTLIGCGMFFLGFWSCLNVICCCPPSAPALPLPLSHQVFWHGTLLACAFRAMVVVRRKLAAVSLLTGIARHTPARPKSPSVVATDSDESVLATRQCITQFFVFASRCAILSHM